MTSSQLHVALREKYPKDEYALFPELRNCTGYSKSQRYADAVAMSLWPSRGINLHGFEMKVSRSDWLAELKNPKKAEAICQFCDFWWIVAADDKIVHTGELPPNWGLLLPHGKTLKAKVAAPKLEAKPLDRDMLASILRNAQANVIPQPVLDEISARTIEERVKSSCYTFEQETKRRNEEVDRLKKQIEDFKKASGVNINQWNSKDIGEAVRFVMNWNKKDHLFRMEKNIELYLRQCSGLQQDLENNMKAIQIFKESEQSQAGRTE